MAPSTLGPRRLGPTIPFSFVGVFLMCGAGAVLPPLRVEPRSAPPYAKHQGPVQAEGPERRSEEAAGPETESGSAPVGGPVGVSLAGATAACCDAAGTCVGDLSQVDCEMGANTWHPEASCVGAGGLPPPVCNRYDVNPCLWDNGPPLNDGGASRAHTHSGGEGQPPRYDFNTASDFILRGPPGDSTPCSIDLVTAYMRVRPSDTTGPVFVPPNPIVDVIGINVTIFVDYVAPNTGLHSPAGFGTVPYDGTDLNPKSASVPGGIVYARTFCTGTLAAEPGICPGPTGAVTMTLLPGFCDPPPAVGFETAAVYQVDVAVDPPILLPKNTTYWLDVQGVFPFNDGLRDTLQIWWMPSEHNTGLRSQTQRTGNTDYTVGGQPAWVPLNVDLVAPFTTPPQRGNAGNSTGSCSGSACEACSVAADCPPPQTCSGGDGVPGPPNLGTCVVPCAGVPQFTRIDHAFRLSGAKASPVPPNDPCIAAAAAFNGVTPFDTTGATTDGLNPASCGTIEQDVWFAYTATCTGVLTMTTCGSQFDSVVAVYDGAACPNEPRASARADERMIDDGKGERIPPDTDASRDSGSGERRLQTGATPSEPRASARADAPNETEPNSRGIIARAEARGSEFADARGSAMAGTRGAELTCNGDSDACGVGSDDAYVQLAVVEGAQYLIRAGGVDELGASARTEVRGSPTDAGGSKAQGASARAEARGSPAGFGLLTIECRETCGAATAGACCTNHAPGVGCNNAACCDIVCATPGREYCCTDLQTGWDQACADTAAVTPACQCPCTHTCPPGAIQETETCGSNTNGGCDSTTNPPPFQSLGTLVLGTPKSACGTLQAGPTTRDTDWWLVSVPATASGVATLTIETSGSAPVGLVAVTREGTLNSAAGEDFCTEKVCLTDPFLPDPEAPPCTNDLDCLPDRTCESVDAALAQLDAIATSGCLSTDGDPCPPLVTCVVAPGQYAIVVTTAAAGPECSFGEGIFAGVTCGAQDDYSYTITATDDCADGACCTCSGGCLDAVSSPPGVHELECRNQRGTFAGEGTLCAGLPPNVQCAETAHGCATAVELVCGQTVQVDLTTLNHPPDEPYLCAASGADPNDSAWFKFTMPTGPDDPSSVRIKTCNSTGFGRDSLLAVYSGSCCELGDPLVGIGCSDDDCGFTDFLGVLCLTDLMHGETYYVQISNWAEPVNGIFTLDLECPCTGSCCDSIAAVCKDDVPIEDCGHPLQFDSTRSCTDLAYTCGFGACCHADGTCNYTTLANCNAFGDNHFLGGIQCSGIVCNVFDSCDYATGDIESFADQAPFGFRSQLAAEIDFLLEVAEPFFMKGTKGTTCFVDTIRYSTFHTSHDTANNCLQGGAGAGCFDDPEDYEGVIVTIAEDLDGTAEGPACVPSFPIDPGSDGDYHEGPGCVNSVVFGPAARDWNDPPYIAPPCTNWWEWDVDCGGQCEWYHTLHFDPPLELEKNRRYWLAITTRMRDLGGYSVIWFASNNFDGQFHQVWSSAGAMEFVVVDGTPNDQLFEIHSAPPSTGCGSCVLYGDVGVPGANCLIDVDDIITVLNGFSNPAAIPKADIFPCHGDPPCPPECDSNQDCINLYGGLTCVNGTCVCTFSLQCAALFGPGVPCDPVSDRCILVDVDDIVAELNAFMGLFDCPAPCPPGACVADFDGNSGTPPECRDQRFVPGGMSLSDCLTAGGTYCGDYSLCGSPGCVP